MELQNYNSVLAVFLALRNGRVEKVTLELLSLILMELTPSLAHRDQQEEPITEGPQGVPRDCRSHVATLQFRRLPRRLRQSFWALHSMLWYTPFRGSVYHFAANVVRWIRGAFERFVVHDRKQPQLNGP